MTAALGGDIMLGELFDPRAELSIRDCCRPHWSQAGAVAFITFRANDSIPRDVALGWERERVSWLVERGYAVPGKWADVVPELPPAVLREFQRAFERRREVCLDTCHGRCLLRQPALARIVADSLLYFDGSRYLMGDFVVMPNHVHLLAALPTEDAMHNQCDSWLHFTACQINRAVGAKGKLWQQEPFDHLVRSPEQYEYLRRYIADNPTRANLGAGEFLYRRDPGDSTGGTSFPFAPRKKRLAPPSTSNAGTLFSRSERRRWG